MSFRAKCESADEASMQSHFHDEVIAHSCANQHVNMRPADEFVAKSSSASVTMRPKTRFFRLTVTQTQKTKELSKQKTTQSTAQAQTLAAEKTRQQGRQDGRGRMLQ